MSADAFAHRVINGTARGPLAASLRGLFTLAEPIYATAARRRNRDFDRGRRESIRLDRPTLSIGNITSGGTGKTPMVRWLCNQLAIAGMRPAVLMRGYKSTTTAGSDERAMLESMLAKKNVIAEANPDRVAGAAAVLARAPDVGAFVLDDGFQHRRVKRDLDIVLISGVEPFGYGHVLPRGLLREPLEGLLRADAVVITHARRAAEQLEAIIARLRTVYPIGPIYRADHSPIGFRTPGVASDAQVDQFDDALRRTPVFAFCGLADPRVFAEQLAGTGARVVGSRWFADHHDYTAADIAAIAGEAKHVGAKVIVTTEKDWAKVQHLPQPAGVAIWRMDVLIRFWGSDEGTLMEQVHVALAKGKAK